MGVFQFDLKWLLVWAKTTLTRSHGPCMGHQGTTTLQLWSYYRSVKGNDTSTTGCFKPWSSCEKFHFSIEITMKDLTFFAYFFTCRALGEHWGAQAEHRRAQAEHRLNTAWTQPEHMQTGWTLADHWLNTGDTLDEHWECMQSTGCGWGKQDFV